MGMVDAGADMMPHSAAPTTRLIASAFTGHLPIVMYCETSVMNLSQNCGPESIRYKYRMIRLTDEQWERIRNHFLEAVRAKNLNPDVFVMQPANQGVRHDASDLMNQARDRSILVQ